MTSLKAAPAQLAIRLTGAVAVVLLSFVTFAQAEQRLALVIGVDNYPNLPNQQQLQKAKADADAVADAFDRIGFEVSRGFDLGRSATNKKLQSLANQIEPGDVVAFFFAGHGVRLDGRNYLLPSDTPGISANERDFLKSEAVPDDSIVDLFHEKGARISLVILDACRNDPFEDSTGRSILGTRGLARMDPPEGTFILFSAGAGQVALDRLPGSDANPNSVFTRNLLPLLTRKGLEIGRMKDLVQASVYQLAKSVGHRQTPAGYDQIVGDFFLAGRSPAQSAHTDVPSDQHAAKVPTEPDEPEEPSKPASPSRSKVSWGKFPEIDPSFL